MAARRQRDLRALGGERPRDGKADAAAGAGDQSDPAFELEFHRPASSIQLHGHVAIARQRAGMVAVGGARRLQDVLPAIAGLLDQPDRLGEIRRARAERHRGAAAQAILDMHIENARRVGGDFLGAIDSRARRCCRCRS